MREQVLEFIAQKNAPGIQTLASQGKLTQENAQTIAQLMAIYAPLRQGIDQYYEMRGIDVETGLPRRSALEALGLAEVADRLENEYHIALPA